MQPEWLPTWLSVILDWMHQEQALVAGVLALIGAGATVCVLRRQIKIQERQWLDAQERRDRASRARLPLALSDLVDYCLESYSICKLIYCNYEKYKNSPPSLTAPNLPGKAIEVLASAVEESLQGDVSKSSSEILNKLQVAHIRLKNSIDTVSSASHIGNINDQKAYALRAFEIEELRAHIETLFEYARGEKDTPTPIRSKVDAERVFRFGKPDGEFEAKVVEFIEAYW
ncbi:MAG: hypothetical protein R3C60_02885 [Parvularculaceae bacterium]